MPKNTPKKTIKIRLLQDVPLSGHSLKKGQVHEVIKTHKRVYGVSGDRNAFWIMDMDIDAGKKVKTKIWDYECEVIK